MTTFDVDYPVVRHVAFRQVCADGRSLRMGDTYFGPIMEELMKDLAGTARAAWPLLVRAWANDDPVDMGSEELILESNDGILERLRMIEERGFDLDLSRVYGTGGRRPAAASVVLSALIAFLEESFRSTLRVGVSIE